METSILCLPKASFIVFTGKCVLLLLAPANCPHDFPELQELLGFARHLRRGQSVCHLPISNVEQSRAVADQSVSTQVRSFHPCS